MRGWERMNRITDDQIAEIEALANDAAPFDWGPDVGMTNAETVYACSVGPDSILALIARLREVERWKADASQVLNPLLDYAHSLGLAKLGHSVTEALIEDHKRLREAERDAARYLWILNHYAELHGDRTLAAMALSSGGLDAAIDAAMLSAREAAE